MRKILDIWTKTATFPRSCLDRLEQRMNAGTPVVNSTTPPYSPGLPPLSEEDRKPKASSNTGQGKYLSSSRARFFRLFPSDACEDLLLSLSQAKPTSNLKTINTDVDTVATDPRLTGGTYIHIALPQTRPLACILYRRILPIRSF